MQLLPIKTKIFHPPQDDLVEILHSALMGIKNGDVVTITSKVVAIHEGRCVPIQDTDKEALVRKEADLIFDPEGRSKPLTVTNNALISAAGIDESNGDGYYILLPTDPFRSAQYIHQDLMQHFNLSKLGVVITDSHSLPFRYGAMSVAIGCWGFKPIDDHAGRPDLFDRLMQFSKTNLPDAIAAATTLVTGECDESQPVTIVRDIPNLVFTEEDPREGFFVPYAQDIYKDLFKDFRKPE